MKYPFQCKPALQLVILFFISIQLTSCFGTKPVPYFSKAGIDTNAIQQVILPEAKIQKGDILSITIYSDDANATAIYNQAGGAGQVSSPAAARGVSTAASASQQISGYLVDNEGEIRMHAIGKLKVEGMTRSDLEELVTTRIKALGVLSNPYCVIRYNNFKVTVLGEVRTPGVYTIPTEKASVLEAIGLAGDIADYGQKDKILLIRENQGQRTYKYLDLTDPSIFSSQDFYLRQNDVLVVQADSKKPTAVDQRNLQIITVAASVISTLAIFISIFR